MSNKIWILENNYSILKKAYIELENTENVQMFLNSILSIILQELKYDCGTIFIVDNNKKVANLVCSKNVDSETIINNKVICLNDDQFRQVFKKGEILTIDNCSEKLKINNLKYIVCIPIIYKLKVFGSINIGSKIKNVLTENEKECLSLLCQSIGNCVEKLILKEKLHKKSTNFKKVNQKLSKEIDIRKVVQKELKNKENLLHEYIENQNNKDEYYANLSHEIRTPLNILINVLPLLEKEVETKKYIRMVKQNSYKLLRIINNLIDITRIESNLFTLNIGNHDIVDVIRNMVAYIDGFIELNDLKIKFKSNIKSKVIACDSEMIERVLLNLISNSIKFTQSGGKIEVKVFQNNDNICFSVKDDGIGIPKNKLNKIFDRFVRANNSLTKKYEGSGIGLAIVKSIVDLHCGKIYVKSKQNQGTEFTVELPCKLIKENEIYRKDFLQIDDLHERVSIELLDINK